MVEEAMIAGLGGIYKSFIESLPFWVQKFVDLFFISLLLVVYAIFIWKFYRWIARKDILALNLDKYNTLEHPFLAKLLTALFYFIEYIIILPVIVFVWFFMFTLFLVLLSKNLDLQIILIISATIITAIRMTSYYNENLAQDLAKMLPLTLLGVAITDFNSFSFEKILEHFSNLPSLFSNLFVYLGFIIVVEVILRSIDILFTLFGILDKKEVNED